MLRVIRTSSLLHYSMGLVLVCAAMLFLWPGLAQNLFASDGFMTHYHNGSRVCCRFPASLAMGSAARSAKECLWMNHA